jgi:diguanylate cyclase (GGDEF)-like protein
VGEANTSLSTTLAERYRVLLEIGRKLSGTLSSAELYRAIYHETAEVLEATGFYISMYDEDRDLATVVFYADRGQEREVRIQYRGSDSEVLRLGRPTLVNDLQQCHSLFVLGDQASETTRSAIAAPLRHNDKIVGTLSSQSYRPCGFTEEDLELLQGIADIAAVAIGNARYVSELERRRLEAEQIEKIGRALTSSLDAREVLQKVITAAAEILGADSATVWLLEGRNRKIKIAASLGEFSVLEGESLDLPREAYERIFERREPMVADAFEDNVIVPDELRPHVRTRGALAVPIIIGGNVVGTLSVGFSERRQFSDEDLHLLQRLASQASVALENAKLHAQLQSISLTDPLTGLPNRRHLQMHLETEFAAAARGRNLAIVLFDLDNFKNYNDSLGHVAGDEALRSVARILESETRSMHLVARYGGDEFISVQSDTTVEGAAQHAERVSQHIASDPTLSPFGITVSYGIARYYPTMRGADDLIREADRDLYRSKDHR